MAKLTTVLFDLDGTLLPMDQEEFTKGYFRMLAGTMAPLGYEPEKLVQSVWAGTRAMIRNDGSCTNEDAFWNTFTSIYGEKAREDIPAFDEFYRTAFDHVREQCGFTERAAETVRLLKQRGMKVALATNPIFPQIATEKRIRWAGLEPEDFLLFTTYENSSYCKPDPAYYVEVAEKIGVAPEECLMVGNDALEDMAAAKIGMKVFLLTDCLINQNDVEIGQFPNGSFDDLLEFFEKLC